jgi:hypothetical protein
MKWLEISAIHHRPDQRRYHDRGSYQDIVDREDFTISLSCDFRPATDGSLRTSGQRFLNDAPLQAQIGDTDDHATAYDDQRPDEN